MSTTLYYEIVIPPKERRKWLPDQLKYILKEKYKLDQGKCRMNAKDIDYLSGLEDAKVDGADKIIKAIQKYGEIDIWISNT